MLPFYIPSRLPAGTLPEDPRDAPGRAFFAVDRSLLKEIYILGVKIINILLGGRDWRGEMYMLGVLERTLLTEICIWGVIDRVLLSEIHIWDVVDRALLMDI